MTGDELRAWRKAADLTVAEAAEMLGVAEVTLRKWEMGLNPVPLIAERLIKALATA